MHILWVNEIASMQGGCERYVRDTADLLRAHGVRSTLLYSANGTDDPGFLRTFDAAFPAVDVRGQIAAVAPDVVYVHRVAGAAAVREIAASGVPAYRFFHDHRLFCPREHKYRASGKDTCTRTIGAACFACCGCVVRKPGAPGIAMVTPSTLRREHRAHRGFAGFVVGSRYMAGHVAAHGFDAAHIHTLPLYAAPPREPAEQVLRERDLLVFAGQLTTGKGVDTLLEAVAITSRPVRLLILGTGPFEAEYRALCTRLGLDQRVTFGGRVGADAMGAYYRRAAAAVFPSRTPETFGLVGPEAMSHGAPVIATLVGGTGEWLKTGITGLAVRPNDPRSLAYAIDRITADDALRVSLGAGARDLYHERFRPEHHVRALLNLFGAEESWEVAA